MTGLRAGLALPPCLPAPQEVHHTKPDIQNPELGRIGTNTRFVFIRLRDEG
jgi:hypothetical protein